MNIIILTVAVLLLSAQAGSAMSFEEARAAVQSVAANTNQRIAVLQNFQLKSYEDIYALVKIPYGAETVPEPKYNDFHSARVSREFKNRYWFYVEEILDAEAQRRYAVRDALAFAAQSELADIALPKDLTRAPQWAKDLAAHAKAVKGVSEINDLLVVVTLIRRDMSDERYLLEIAALRESQGEPVQRLISLTKQRVKEKLAFSVTAFARYHGISEDPERLH